MSDYLIDASVAIKWVVAEAGSAEALGLLGNRLFAPALLQAECANILWKKVTRGEMSAREAAVAAGLLSHFGIRSLAAEPSLARVLEIAVALRHAAYDCVYLAAAHALQIPVITADARLARIVGAASSTPLLQGISMICLHDV